MKKILLVIVSVIICISCGNGNRDKIGGKSKDKVGKQFDTLDRVYISSRKDVELKLDEYRKRDSIIENRSQSQIDLSFMGYELGESYSKSKGKRKKLLGKDITRLDVCHYDDTIYQIRVEFSDYKNGLYKFDEDIIKLYKSKYGVESTSDFSFREWNFYNGKIRIDVKRRNFDHRGLIISETANKPTMYVPISKVVEIVITYLDYKTNSIALQKRKRDLLFQEKMKEQEKNKHFQESIESI